MSKPVMIIDVSFKKHSERGNKQKIYSRFELVPVHEWQIDSGFVDPTSIESLTSFARKTLRKHDEWHVTIDAIHYISKSIFTKGIANHGKGDDVEEYEAIE